MSPIIFGVPFNQLGTALILPSPIRCTRHSTKKLYFLDKQLTFLTFQFDAVFSAPSQNGFYTFNILNKGFAEDDEIIKVWGIYLVTQSRKMSSIYGWNAAGVPSISRERNKKLNWSPFPCSFICPQILNSRRNGQFVFGLSKGTHSCQTFGYTLGIHPFPFPWFT